MPPLPPLRTTTARTTLSLSLSLSLALALSLARSRDTAHDESTRKPPSLLSLSRSLARHAQRCAYPREVQQNAVWVLESLVRDDVNRAPSSVALRSATREECEGEGEAVWEAEERDRGAAGVRVREEGGRRRREESGVPLVSDRSRSQAWAGRRCSSLSLSLSFFSAFRDLSLSLSLSVSVSIPPQLRRSSS